MRQRQIIPGLLVGGIVFILFWNHLVTYLYTPHVNIIRTLSDSSPPLAAALELEQKLRRFVEPQNSATAGKTIDPDAPLLDPNQLYDECRETQLEHLCRSIFYDPSYLETPPHPDETISILTLFDSANKLDVPIFNLEKAKATIERDKVMPYRIIAMSVFGKSPRYCRGMLSNLIIIYNQQFFKGWKIRIYYDLSVPYQLLHMARILGAELYLMQDTRSIDSAVDTSGTFWRFLVFWDERITRFLLRDSDARLWERDESAVGEWVQSGHLFHVQRDHPFHHTEIMGGMWGTVGGAIDTRSKLISVAVPKKIETGEIRYGDDQTWLVETLWPFVRNYTLAHDSFFCKRFLCAEIIGHPNQRKSLQDFVGNAYEPENRYTGRFIDKGAFAPVECRRNAAWEYG